MWQFEDAAPSVRSINLKFKNRITRRSWAIFRRIQKVGRQDGILWVERAAIEWHHNVLSEKSVTFARWIWFFKVNIRCQRSWVRKTKKIEIDYTEETHRDNFRLRNKAFPVNPRQYLENLRSSLRYWITKIRKRKSKVGYELIWKWRDLF